MLQPLVTYVCWHIQNWCTRLTASCRLTQRSKSASEMMRVDHLLVGGIWIQAILQPRKNTSNKGWKVFSVDLKWWLRHVETHRIKASMIKWQFTHDTYFACMSVCMYVTMNECVKLQLHDTIGSPQNILIFTEWLDGWMDAHETKHKHISAYSLQKNNTDQRWPNGNFPLNTSQKVKYHRRTTGKTGQTICFWPNHLSLGLRFKSIINGIYWPCFPSHGKPKTHSGDFMEILRHQKAIHFPFAQIAVIPLWPSQVAVSSCFSEAAPWHHFECMQV